MVLHTFDLSQLLRALSVRLGTRNRSQKDRHGLNSTDCLIRDNYQGGITSGKSKKKVVKLWQWMKVSLFKF